MRAVLVGAFLALCLAPRAEAETAYVTDMLQLGLHNASDTSDRAVANLTSGTALEVLERGASYARVRTPDGAEGWVKAAYLVSEPPARYRLAQLEDQLTSLRVRAAEAQASEKGAVTEAAHLRSEFAGQREAADALRERLARVESKNAAYEERFDGHGLSLPLPWVVGALALALVVGALAGWWALDSFIRHRYAGYRIY